MMCILLGPKFCVGPFNHANRKQRSLWTSVSHPSSAKEKIIRNQSTEKHGNRRSGEDRGYVDVVAKWVTGKNYECIMNHTNLVQNISDCMSSLYVLQETVQVLSQLIYLLRLGEGEDCSRMEKIVPFQVRERQIIWSHPSWRKKYVGDSVATYSSSAWGRFRTSGVTQAKLRNTRRVPT